MPYHSFCEVTRVCLTWRALFPTLLYAINDLRVIFVGMKNDTNETCAYMVFGLRQSPPTRWTQMACKNRASCQDIALHREDQQKRANKFC